MPAQPWVTRAAEGGPTGAAEGGPLGASRAAAEAGPTESASAPELGDRGMAVPRTSVSAPELGERCMAAPPSGASAPTLAAMAVLTAASQPPMLPRGDESEARPGESGLQACGLGCRAGTRSEPESASGGARCSSLETSAASGSVRAAGSRVACLVFAFFFGRGRAPTGAGGGGAPGHQAPRPVCFFPPSSSFAAGVGSELLVRLGSRGRRRACMTQKSFIIEVRDITGNNMN